MTSPTVALTMAVAPRLTASVSEQPLGGGGTPNLRGAYVSNAIHHVTIAGVVDPVSGTAYTSGTASATLTLLNARTNALLLAETAMTYDAAGTWHADAPAASFPGGILIEAVVRVYSGATVERVTGLLLVPVAPVALEAASLSINRLAVAGLADLGVLQDDSATSCTVTLVNGAGATIVSGAAMTYLAPNAWYYDAASGIWPVGAVMTATVNVLDLAGTTQRGTVSARLIVTGPALSLPLPIGTAGVYDAGGYDIARHG